MSAPVKRVRWACPNGCTDVIGPSKPRSDAAVRYCLPCTAKSGKLVRRTVPSLDAKRARAKAKMAAAATRKVERARAKKKAKEIEREAQKEAPDRPRQSGIDYVIQLDDATAGDGTRTVATFGRDHFREAMLHYFHLRKSQPGARLLKVFERGWVMTPILGYVMTRYGCGRKAHLERGQLIIGWNRIEPPYRGSNYWTNDEREWSLLLPGRVIVQASVKSPRRGPRRIRLHGVGGRL